MLMEQIVISKIQVLRAHPCPGLGPIIPFNYPHIHIHETWDDRSSGRGISMKVLSSVPSETGRTCEI